MTVYRDLMSIVGDETTDVHPESEKSPIWSSCDQSPSRSYSVQLQKGAVTLSKYDAWRLVGHCHVETIGRPRVHETKQTLNEVERFFYNFAEFVSEDRLRRLSENFSVFYKVSSQIAFCNTIAPLPKSQTRHPAPANARAPLSSLVSSGFLCKVG